MAFSLGFSAIMDFLWLFIYKNILRSADKDIEITEGIWIFSIFILLLKVAFIIFIVVEKHSK